MDFDLDDDQLELQRVIRELVDQECPPSLVREVIAGESDAGGLWKTLVSMDLPGLAIPETHGGTGATAVELAIVLEELGRGADPTPFLATTSQYVPMVREALDEGMGAGLLEAVCTGSTGSVAFAEKEVRAEPAGDGWTLAGTAHHVIDGDRADQLAVVATAGDGVGVFVVSSDEVAATRTPAFDGTLHVSELVLDGVEVSGDRSTVGPRVRSDIDRAAHEAVTGLAAGTVGACQRILELALDHVRDRRQFGVPVGSFQAVKHMAVDMYVAIERARALCHYAALTIAEDDPRRGVAASMAKAAAGDAQRLVAQQGIQLFGGLGFTWENDLQLYVRRAKSGELLLGSSSTHRSLVARATVARVSAEEQVG